MILGRLLQADERNRIWEIPGTGETMHGYGTPATGYITRILDINPDLPREPTYEKAFLQAEENLVPLDVVLEINELERMYSVGQTAAAISNTDFLNVEGSLVSQISKAWESSVSEAMKGFVIFMDELNSEVTEEMITQLIVPYLDVELGERFYFSAAVRKAVKQNIERTWKAGKKRIADQLKIPIPQTTMMDLRARNWLMDDTRFWLRHRYTGEIRGKIAETARKVGIEQGLGRREVGRAMAKAFSGIAHEQAYYWEIVGSSAVGRGRSWSELLAFEEAGVEVYEIYTAGDERVCPICGELHGTRVAVEGAIENIAATLDADNPFLARNISPWINYSKARDLDGRAPFYTSQYNSKGEIIGKRYFDRGRLKDGKFLNKIGSGQPPFHGLCRCYLVIV